MEKACLNWVKVIGINGGKYSQSIKKFQKIINGKPRDGLADDDKFWISGSYEKLTDLQNVKDPYQKILTNYPNSKRINQVKYEIERVEYLIRNYVRVIESEQTEIQVEF